MSGTVTIPLSAVEAKAASLPDEYRREVMAAGVVDGDRITFSKDDFERLRKKYGNPPILTPRQLLDKFLGAIGTWSAQGFPVVSREQLTARFATCRACDEWSGFHCRACGCTGLKLWLATENCPLGKWPNID